MFRRVAVALASIFAACVPDYSGFDGVPGPKDGGAASGGQDGGGQDGGGGVLGCETPEDCTTKSAPICDDALGQCVECLPNADQCPSGTWCSAGSCEIGCKSDADCGTLSCDMSSHLCTGCTGQNQCPSGTLCEAGTKTCKPGCVVASTCPTGFDCCGGLCTNTNTSGAHCGKCDATCAPRNATGTCSDGVCSTGSCSGAFGDCDSNPANGCETDTATTLAHCGGCGAGCSNSNGTPSCAGGNCAIACAAGFADCDKAPRTNGCEVDTQSDVKNCGSCGNACPASAPNCTQGACKTVCGVGKANCDGNAANGCEADITSNPAHCGGCNQPCAANAYCSNGSCLTCAANKANCDGNAANGCEASLLTDEANCGACGSTCGACTCQNGKCAAGSTVYFSEDFSDNSAGWTTAIEWQIGPAAPSTGHTFGFPDPAQDHTPTADNGLAGIVIGGNAVTGVTTVDLTSPPIDLTAATGTVTLSYWRWLNAEGPDDDDVKVSPDGVSWVTIWKNPVGTGTSDSSWTLQQFDVTAHKSATFRIRFHHDKDGTMVTSGGSIDDVALSGACN